MLVCVDVTDVVALVVAVLVTVVVGVVISQSANSPEMCEPSNLLICVTVLLHVAIGTKKCWKRAHETVKDPKNPGPCSSSSAAVRAAAVSSHRFATVVSTRSSKSPRSSHVMAPDAVGQMPKIWFKSREE